MTIGANTLDARYSYTFPLPAGSYGGGTTRVGQYRSRSWNGQDRTVAQKASRVVSRIPKTVIVGGQSYQYRRKNPMRRADVPHPYTVAWNNHNFGQYQALRDQTDLEKWFAKIWTITDGDNFRGFQASTWGMDAVDPEYEYEILEKIRDKVYGSGFHPGIFLGEGPQAVRMIGTAAHRLYYGTLSAANGDMRGAFRFFGEPRRASDIRRLKDNFLSVREGRKTIASLWLELQYGWLPLLGDIESGARYIGNTIGGAYPVSQGVRARKKWEYTEQGYASGWSYLTSRRVSNQLQYVITDLQVDPVLGLPSLASVAGVAWELLPYSFVADWVAPVGDYLEACRTASNIRGKVVRSHRQVMTFTGCQHGSDAPYNTRSGSLLGSPTSVEKGWFTRTVSDHLTPPSPIGDLSPSSIFSSWKRSLNAVALLQNLRIDPNDRMGFKSLARKAGLA